MRTFTGRGTLDLISKVTFTSRLRRVSTEQLLPVCYRPHHPFMEEEDASSHTASPIPLQHNTLHQQPQVAAGLCKQEPRKEDSVGSELSIMQVLQEENAQIKAELQEQKLRNAAQLKVMQEYREQSSGLLSFL